MAKENLIVKSDYDVTNREIDFVSRFEMSWEHLTDLLGIMRPIRKAPGTKLKSKYAAGTLESGDVGEGEEIPYSKYTVKETDYDDVTIEKYSTGVSLESIIEHGYDVAVAMIDDQFLYDLQAKVTDKFYNYLNTGTLNVTGANTFQMALARAKGSVLKKFKAMHKRATNVVAFVNIMDVYNYLGAAEISIQNEFGFNYIKNFMGYSVVFLLGDEEIQPGRVIATAVENIVLYYVDPSDSAFAKAGLPFTTSNGETNLIGFHTDGNYHTMVSESFALMGMVLFAEYIDAIAVADFAGE